MSVVHPGVLFSQFTKFREPVGKFRESVVDPISAEI